MHSGYWKTSVTLAQSEGNLGQADGGKGEEPGFRLSTYVPHTPVLLIINTTKLCLVHILLHQGSCLVFGSGLEPYRAPWEEAPLQWYIW